MMYQQQRAPMEGVANQMAKHGRYGDSMLVHMNPIEVQGIASLSPTGQLTRNPVTGQPEAFLPFLAPLLGSMFGSTMLGAAGSALGSGAIGSALTAAAANAPLASAIGSGLATTAATGDLKQGLLSGLTGYGLGSALQATADTLNPAIAGAEEALTGVGKEIGATTADLARSQAGLDAAINQVPTTSTAPLTGLDAAINKVPTATEAFSSAGQVDPFSGAVMSPNLTPAQAAVENAGQVLGRQQSTLSGLQAQQAGLQNQIDTARQAMTPMDRLSAPFQQPGAFGSAMMKSSTLVPIALGEGKREELRVQDELDAMGRKEKRREEENLNRSLGTIGSSYDQLESDYGYMNYKIPGRAAGGITSVNPKNYMDNVQGLQRLASGGTADYSPVINPRDAGQRQSNIRGSKAISPEELQGYRPGFSPEIIYFKEDAPTGTTTDGYSQADDAVMGGQYQLTPDQQAQLNMALGGKGGFSGVGGPDFDAMSYNYSTNEPLSGMNAGSALTAAGIGSIRPSYTGATRVSTNPRGDIYSKYTQQYQEGGDVEVDIEMQTAPDDEFMAETNESNGGRLIEMAALAIAGRLAEEEASVIIQRFIDEFGPEAFQMLRERVLKQSVPNAQTEGKIDGNGKGMDDMVPGMIGDQQPVAVSPGEYIVPADVVSGLGDGDTGAGAQELDQMMERVRQERTGTAQQPRPLNTDKVMPV